MENKHSVLIKYKYLEYIENANLSNNDAWLLIKAIIEYDKNGVMPVFHNPVSTALFAIIKSDIDENREKWEGVVKSKSDAGKKGMEKRWGKEDITEDNKNNTCYNDITEITPVISVIKNITPITKITELDSGYDLDSESGDGNDNGEKQPPLFLIKTKIKEHGFFLDDDLLLERLIAEIDPPWFEGRHTFVDFIARKVQAEYGYKPAEEQHRVFRKLLFAAPNLRELYPHWRRQQEDNDALRAGKEAMEAAQEKHPEVCGNCGTKLWLYDGKWVCDHCKAHYTFSQKKLEWDYHGPPEGDLSEQFREQKHRGVQV